jgi:hypothetical protein
MVYAKIKQPILGMTEVIIEVMTEVIFVLALATKQINQGRLSKFFLLNKHLQLMRSREICKETPGRK